MRDGQRSLGMISCSLPTIRRMSDTLRTCELSTYPRDAQRDISRQENGVGTRVPVLRVSRSRRDIRVPPGNKAVSGKALWSHIGGVGNSLHVPWFRGVHRVGNPCPLAAAPPMQRATTFCHRYGFPGMATLRRSQMCRATGPWGQKPEDEHLTSRATSRSGVQQQ